VEELNLRPLTARSVLASTLLGSKQARLPVSFLIRTGALFGLSEGSVRTALSRMVSAGEVTHADGCYGLAPALTERRERQLRSRAAKVHDWSGRWWIGVVAAGTRSARDRAALRVEMDRARLAELREGVWVRPDNLDSDARPDRAVTASPCWWFVGDLVVDLDREDRTEADLVAELWDLEGWARRARKLRKAMHELRERLEADDTSALAPGFMVSAATMRHFVADPLLPRELLPRDWPGEALRSDFEEYDRTYRQRLTEWTKDAPVAARHG